MTQPDTVQQALAAVSAAGGDVEQARWLLEVLERAGISLASQQHDELVGRWIDVRVRAVPPEADTIIRTITKTVNGQASSSTHWLEGLGPPFSTR
jgi:hypothetical protein